MEPENPMGKPSAEIPPAGHPEFNQIGMTPPKVAVDADVTAE